MVWKKVQEENSIINTSVIGIHLIDGNELVDMAQNLDAEVDDVEWE